MVRSVKIWLDALTPKQAMLFGSMYHELVLHGYSALLTARNYEYTTAVLKQLGVNFVAIGGYGYDLKSKLVEELKRMLSLLDTIESFDALIAYPNPGAARVAFALQKHYIALTDSPHSEIPSRLSLPLASAVVISSCIPKKLIDQYVFEGKTYIIQYNGVDEVQWLKDFKPDKAYLKSLDLDEYSYIVVRPPEIMASYYKNGIVVNQLIEKIIQYFINQGLSIVYLPRYDHDAIISMFGGMKNFIIPSTEVGVKGPQLLYHAVASISGGGTMAREAALIGTLGISLFPQELCVDTCLQKKGFPISHLLSFESIVEKIKESLRDVERYKKEALITLQTLEKPISGVLKVFEALNLV
ncbi:MAG: DUF354 domain-containing protein [Ignisphaera sp.]|nr:DUF354 domain-containing protein [Ignisphaera sp.]MCX8168112.1 DUF354 domain-containing protein [Ignisphaera sp.]MDW8085453.1 DUF354 domain-containing protein [Ignisphaera sp.]